MSQGKKILYTCKGLVTRNIHVKYQSSNIYHSKATAKVKVFGGWQKDRMTEGQTGQKPYPPPLLILGA
jgi:hypothetical protein